MPRRPTESEDEELNPLQWIMFNVYRLLMPYNYLIEQRPHISRYNLRYVTPEEAYRTLLADWIIMPFIWLQACVMFWLTLPLWPFVADIL